VSWAGARLAAFARFLYDFVIGEDWRLAAGVAAGIAITALIAHESEVSAWWVLPAAVAVMLSLSVWRAARTRR
jgi:hypothetical protein